MVRDIVGVGVTLPTDDGEGLVRVVDTRSSLTRSGIVPTCDGVGVPRRDDVVGTLRREGTLLGMGVPVELEQGSAVEKRVEVGGTSAVPYKLSDLMVGMVEGKEAVEYVVNAGDLRGSEAVAYLVDGVGVMLLERSICPRDQERSVR